MDVDMHEELASQSQGFTQEDDQLLLSLGGNASALQGQIKEVFCALSERKMGPEELSSISQRAVQLYRDAVFETPWRCYICEQHDLVSKGYANTVVRGMGGSNLDKHLHDRMFHDARRNMSLRESTNDVQIYAAQNHQST